MTTKQPVNFNPREVSNFDSNFPYVIQGLSERWFDSKYGAENPCEAIELAKTLDICITDTTKLRVVKALNNIT